MKVGRCPINAAERVGRHVAAHHQEVAAELLHHVEFALGPREHLRALRLRHALEITEWLEDRRRESEVGDHAAHVIRRSVKGEKVVLENLDRLEPSRGDGFEFFGKGAAETNGSDGILHEPNLRMSLHRARERTVKLLYRTWRDLSIPSSC